MMGIIHLRTVRQKKKAAQLAAQHSTAGGAYAEESSLVTPISDEKQEEQFDAEPGLQADDDNTVQSILGQFVAEGSSGDLQGQEDQEQQ